MVCVIKARMAEETRINCAQAHENDWEDRGSDAGDMMCMESGGTEPACACACPCDCMTLDAELYDLHDTGTGTVFDYFAQEVAPEETLDLEGLPNDMHEHVVQTNSLDDDFDNGFD